MAVVTLYDVIDTNYFTACINANKPVCFVKWGDGEYCCVIGVQGTNCDGDKFIPELGEAMRIAFLKLTQAPNTFFGRWHLGPNDIRVANYFNALWETTTSRPISDIPWVNYHCLLRDAERGRKPDMLNFVKAIQSNPRKKIYVCNTKNARLCELFGAEHVEVPMNSWFIYYEKIMEEIKSKITPDCIVLFSAGLCTKVAVSSLVESNPGITCLDLGSSFDCLARGTPSRAYQGSFNEEVAYYASVLDADWAVTTPSS